MVLTAARPRRMWGVNDGAGSGLYIPKIAVVERIVDETPDTKTFRLRFEDEDFASSFSWEPGQFVEVTVFGVGEAPIGFASNPMEPCPFELTVVARGKVTRAMHALRVGDRVGIRGPLGNCWPLEQTKGMDLLIVSGGCGLAPLRPLILHVLANRNDYGDIWLLYGARTPADRDYKQDLETWAARNDMYVLQSVDVPDGTWKQHVGVVGSLLPLVKLNPEETAAFVCGPPVMIKFVARDLLKMGFTEDRVITSLERHMKCGIGKCGHCCINHLYVCTDGPIFTYQQVRTLYEIDI